MPASPKRSLQRPRSKWGFSMESLVCLGSGVLVFFYLMLFNVPFIVSLAIGIGLGAALGLTFGKGSGKVMKGLYRPKRIIRGFLPNEKYQHQRFSRKNKA